LRIIGSVEEQKIPRLGSEVRFNDGVTAGRIREINEEGFVVVRGKKRVRRLFFPYSSIEGMGNRVVMLRSTRTEALGKNSSLLSPIKESLTKKRFLRDIDRRLDFHDLSRAERITRITLYLMSQRLSPDQKKQLKKCLPSGIRSLWTSVEQHGTSQTFDMRDFLLPIKKMGRLPTLEDAFIAAREIFSILKEIMPSAEAMDISRSMPHCLQEIWDCAL
jgi:uncharacterized protein (DUF2267 family)